jgi:hypothetical protein
MPCSSWLSRSAAKLSKQVSIRTIWPTAAGDMVTAQQQAKRERDPHGPAKADSAFKPQHQIVAPLDFYPGI